MCFKEHFTAMCKKLYQPTAAKPKKKTQLQQDLAKHEKWLRDKKADERYKDGLTCEERAKMWKMQRAIREGVKPVEQDLQLLTRLREELPADAVVQAIWSWYCNHGCMKLSQLTYLRARA